MLSRERLAAMQRLIDNCSRPTSSLSKRRARDSNSQPLSGHHISSVAANHSLTLQTAVFGAGYPAVCPGSRNEQAVNTSQNHDLNREYSSENRLRNARGRGHGERVGRKGRSLPGETVALSGRQVQPRHGLAGLRFREPRRGRRRTGRPSADCGASDRPGPSGGGPPEIDPSRGHAAG